MVAMKECVFCKIASGEIPAKVVYKDDEIAINTNPFGKEVEIIKSPFGGIVIGIATYPTVTPGQAVCHMVELNEEIKKVEESLKN